MNTSERAFNPLLRLYEAPAFWAGLATVGGIAAILVSPALLALLLGAIALVSLALYSPFALLAATLVLAPLRTLIQTEAPLPLPLDIGQLLVALFAAVWALHRGLHRQRIITLDYTVLALPLVAFVLVGMMSWWWTHSLAASIAESIKWLTILIAAAFIHANADNGRWRIFVGAVVAAAAANAVVGIYIFFGGSGADHLAIGGRFFRAFGTFGQPNPFGGFMGLTLPLALLMALDHARRWLQRRQQGDAALGLSYAAASLLISAALIMSWSRGAWLAASVSLVVVLVLLPRRLWQRAGLLVTAVAIGAGVWISDVLPRAITERITSAAAEFFAFDDMRGVDITSENYAVVERLAHWQAALNMAEGHPFGVGLGAFNAAYEAHRLLNWPLALGHAHNYYLNVLAETGMIGLIVYLMLLGSLLGFAVYSARHPSPSLRCLAFGLTGSWMYLAIHSILDNLYVNNVFLHVGVLTGLTYWLYQQTAMRSQTVTHGHGSTL